ncbi:MAG: transporter substrate-binding domain-containing protein [Clostridia bacterium]|nr:transporter substrate-binding domain-containing protein [Clostridia bacterium]
MKSIKMISLLLALLTMLGLLCPFAAGAVERKNVRLGYYELAGFSEGAGDDARKSGYVYDYLQRISDYTGWTYEYVYGDRKELHALMEAGELDLIAGVAETDVPARTELAARPILEEVCSIYKPHGDDTIQPGFAASFIGKRIGAVADTPNETFLNAFKEENLVSCEVVTLASQAELREAVQTGAIDAFAAMDTVVSKDTEITACLTIGSEGIYIGVSPSKRTLLRELNDADAQLRNEAPGFLDELYNKYYRNVNLSVAQTDREKAWLRVHKELRIGYLKDYLPFCAADENGQPVGLLKDYIGTLENRPELSGLEIVAVPYEDSASAVADLQAGEIHAMFPVVRDTWSLDRLNLRGSNAVFSQAVDLIFTGVWSDNKTKTIALSDFSTPIAGYVGHRFPESEIVRFATWDECIAAVKSGKAGSTVMNRYKSSECLQQPGNTNLRSVGAAAPCELAFAVRSTDVELLSLINRGIRLMGPDAIDSSVNSYVYFGFDYSLSAFLAGHIEGAIVTVALFVLLLAAGFAGYVFISRKSRREMQQAQDELSEAKDRLTEALDRADFANRSKTRFLFNMSHDIRTPMNAILGFADLLEKHDGDPEKRRRYTENIKTAGGYLLDLINEVLEMARIESGTISLNEEPGDYTEMLHAVDIVLSDACNKKQQSMRRHSDIRHPRLLFDATKERTILLNLISNAVKYTPAGGSIGVTVTELAGPDAETVVLESVISDNGIGMSKEFLPHIFDSFSREKTVTESKIVGTGLGMGIVKSYVELMGGTIEIESEPGKGTTITTRIPHRIAQEFAEPGRTETADADIAIGKRVLLAEDNELNREIAKEILSEAGMEVRCACDGVECVAILSDEPAGSFDLILMDIQMPDMDGLKATETIRRLADREKAEIPIIAMTANVFDTDKQRAYEAGMNGFTGKPIQVGALMAEIARVLSEKRSVLK